MENAENIQPQAKPHPIIAGIIDFYIISLAIAATASIYNTATQTNIWGESGVFMVLGILIITIMATLAYYNLFAKKVQFLSFGEYMAGRRIKNSQKYWTNPYGCNRFGIFLIVFINLIILGNTFDRGTVGYIYPVFELFAMLIRVSIILSALRLLGRRNLNGIIIFIVMSIVATMTSFSQNTYPELRTFGVIFSLTLTVIYCSVYFVYRKKINTVSIESDDSI